MLLFLLSLGLAFLTKATPLFLEVKEHDLQHLSLAKRVGKIDPCANMASVPSGATRNDCQRENELQTDGRCKVPTTATAQECQAYCEVRRTVFLGPEVIVQGVQSVGNTFPPKTTAELTEGIEFSIETTVGFNLGASFGLDKVFEAGVSFAYTTGRTTTKSVTQSSEPSDRYHSRWVAFPILIETCGTITKVDSQILPGGGRGQTPVSVCNNSKNPRTTINVCSTVPALSEQGIPMMTYALQFIEVAAGNGQPVSLDNQNAGYKALCEGWAQGKCLSYASP